MENNSAYNEAVHKEIMDILKNYISINRIKCSNPLCQYENSSSNNYCVKCGRLLPGCSTIVVISSNEYAELKKKANMSAWDKIKEKFSK